MVWRVRNHGTESLYARGCRCDLCKAAHSHYNCNRKRLRRGLVPKHEMNVKMTTSRNRIDRMLELAQHAKP